MTLPRSTWAVRVHEHGGPGALVHEELPLPELGADDVLVEVDTASVSGWDLKYRRGLPSELRLPGRNPFPLPQQLGREAAGTVLAVGPQVARLRLGDRVVAVVHPENPDSPEAIRGLGNLSTGIDLPGHQAPGGYAQHLVRREGLWLPVPDHVNLEQAAVTLWPYATSRRILVDRLRIGLDDTVLVSGATGAMGLATIRLATLMGARAIALTRHPAKAEALQRAGAEVVLLHADHRQVAAEVRALTGGDGVDHAVDFSGSATVLRLAVDTLRLGGGICPATGEQHPAGPVPITAFDLTSRELTVVGIRGARHRDALAVLSLLGQGRLHTPIAARFPLAQAAQAHRLLENNIELAGSVVLKPHATT